MLNQIRDLFKTKELASILEIPIERFGEVILNDQDIAKIEYIKRRPLIIVLQDNNNIYKVRLIYRRNDKVPKLWRKIIAQKEVDGLNEIKKILGSHGFQMMENQDHLGSFLIIRKIQ